MSKNNDPIRPLKSFQRNKSIPAKRLNESVSALNRITRKSVHPLQVLRRPRNRLIVRRYKIISQEQDILIVNGIQEKSETEGNVRVAKPFLLRRTPFDGDSRIAGGEKISYVYNSNFERVATNTSGTDETQVIVPSYTVDDEIWAVHGIVDQTGVRINDEDVGWLDLNTDARAWAKKFQFG